MVALPVLLVAVSTVFLLRVFVAVIFFAIRLVAGYSIGLMHRFYYFTRVMISQCIRSRLIISIVMMITRGIRRTSVIWYP